LDLELERGSIDVLDTERDWMWPIEGWNSHDHDRSVKLALDLDRLPISLLHLLNLGLTILNDGLTLDSW
jgi:hypothetical protein